MGAGPGPPCSQLQLCCQCAIPKARAWLLWHISFSVCTKKGPGNCCSMRHSGIQPKCTQRKQTKRGKGHIYFCTQCCTAAPCATESGQAHRISHPLNTGQGSDAQASYHMQMLAIAEPPIHQVKQDARLQITRALPELKGGKREEVVSLREMEKEKWLWLQVTSRISRTLVLH